MIAKYRIKWNKYTKTAALLSAAVLAVILWMVYTPTSALEESSQFVRIEQGQGLSSIASALKERGLVRSSVLFMVYVSGQGWERYLKAGDYMIPQDSDMSQIASQIAGGRGISNDVIVFIPEGSNIWEIDQRFRDAGLVKEGQFAAAYRSREGHLFPDTYRFKKNSLLGEIVQKMENNGQEKTEELLAGLSPLEQEKILVIASIIEKEARTESDMRLVSGVIQNRLKIGMALEIDATVSYGACVREFNRNTSKDCQVHLVAVGREVRIDSPYNSYTRKGLPPGPISNPGLVSIKAALNPQASAYYYYLSTRDGSQILFSKTGAEHAAKRRQYLGI